MKYPNGKKALKLLIVSFFIILIASVVSGIASNLLTEGIGAIVGTVITIVCGIAALVAAILILVAYYKGGKDSPSLKNAFQIEIVYIIVTVAEIVFYVLYSFVIKAEWMDKAADVCTVFSNIIEILSFYYVCQGCAELCDDEKILNLSKNAIIYYTVAIVISCIASIIAILISNEAAVLVSLILSLISDLVIISAYIVRLVLIFKANAECK